MTTKAVRSGVSRVPWLFVAGGVVVVAVLTAYPWRDAGRTTTPPPGMRYTAEGYGGFVPVKKAVATPLPVTPGTTATPAVPPISAPALAKPLSLARAAYQKGRYAEAEKAAAQVVLAATKPAVTTPAREPAATPAPVETRKRVAEARHLLAFAAARERFAQAELEAAGLPPAEPQKNQTAPSESATLSEDSAYQRAVCAMAAGDKEGAEREFIAFMHKYPESPLVHASVKRIARMHGGDIPPEADAAWKTAMATAQSRERERERSQSLCGPECLAELLKRQGGKGSPDTDALAKEMATDHLGTRIGAIEAAAKRRGFPQAQAVALTLRGLYSQKLPLMALIPPGHYVLIDQIGEDGAVTVWDANGNGMGKPASRTYTPSEWARLWEASGGIAVVLSK